MNKFITFGLQYIIDIDKDQQIIIEDVTYFPQYKGYTVKDIYDFLEMDPWNEEIDDIYESEITGDELDLINKDLEELSYKGKKDLLSKDEDLKREYESGQITEEEISTGLAFDLIWECQSEDDEWKEKYVSFLKETIDSTPNMSRNNKRKFTELLNNAHEMMCDNLVVLVYRVKAN
ncbi:MAG: hypothetical protein ACOVQG_07030 [Crocinitomicaceae bacterium]|jgi:hypothetical protein